MDRIPERPRVRYWSIKEPCRERSREVERKAERGAWAERCGCVMFKMGMITVCVYADGKEPTVRGECLMQERERDCRGRRLAVGRSLECTLVGIGEQMCSGDRDACGGRVEAGVGAVLLLGSQLEGQQVERGRGGGGWRRG